LIGEVDNVVGQAEGIVHAASLRLEALPRKPQADSASP
jgi:hypothetical protein